MRIWEVLRFPRPQICAQAKKPTDDGVAITRLSLRLKSSVIIKLQEYYLHISNASTVRIQFQQASHVYYNESQLESTERPTSPADVSMGSTLSTIPSPIKPIETWWISIFKSHITWMEVIELPIIQTGHEES
jgi:hypothetical protein